jgi:ABC-type multidrug transport system ATPase subunit
MNPCPHCGSGNADGHKFCRQCGKALAPPTADSTVRWASPVPHGSGLARTVPIERLFAAKKAVLLGRAPECEVYLPHPSVSRRHALLEWQAPTLRLCDLGSVNGVHVNGRRVHEPVVVKEHERVGIGPFLFCLSGGVIHFLDSSQSLRLEARGLEKSIDVGQGRPRKLLDDISLAVEPGEFVSLLGPSGSGKSTLMDCLNGRRPATGGKVLANGEDFYLHFDSFRQSLGYVPQRDIVHPQLSVYRALYYTARLRLPTDTGPGELAARIEEVLALMELGPHRDTLVGSLSGGQVKRVSLGAELLARPCLLYIDEATSGLDAGTEARMMHLFRRLADEGKSVICITHNVDNVDLCNLILVLARGRLVFYGPPGEARSYFGVGRVSDIYDRLAGREPEAWVREFAGCSLYREFVASRLAARAADTLVPAAPAHKPAAAPLPEGSAKSLSQNEDGTPKIQESRPHFGLGSKAGPALSHSIGELNLAGRPGRKARSQRPPLWHQFMVLTTRYAELLARDRHSLRLLLLQAPVVAFFILLGFIDKPYQEEVLAPRRLTAAEQEAAELVAIPARRAYQQSKARIAPYDPEGKVRDMVQVLEELPHARGPVVPVKLIVNPRFTYMLLFLVVLIVLWFGCNNASKEIVKEEAIYGRERAVNLGILPYLASKFLPLTLITAVHALMLMVVVYGVLALLGSWLGHDVPAPEYYLAYLPQLGVLTVLAMTSVALGLLLSACVATEDRANALLPYVLIPQIILGGGILSIRSGPLYYIAVLFSPAYWAYRAVHCGAGTILTLDFPGHMDYADNVWLPVAALTVQTAVFLALAAWFLRRKDLHRA